MLRSPKLRHLALAVLALTFFGAWPPPSQALAQTASQYFTETQHNLQAGFLYYWTANGGLAQQGYPLTEEFQEKSALNGQTYNVQYFERAVFEYHPENVGTPYAILLSQLGTYRYHEKYPYGAPNQVPWKATDNPPSLVFPQTGKTLGGLFRQYWEGHGGLAQQGYPISDPFPETSPIDNKTYTVQYFERAVFEYHPEYQGTPYVVLLSQLGKFQLDERYPNDSNQAAAPAAPLTGSGSGSGSGTSTNTQDGMMISVTPDMAPPGGTIQVSGQSLNPRGRIRPNVYVNMYGSPNKGQVAWSMGDVTSLLDSTGSFTSSFTVPADAPPDTGKICIGGMIGPSGAGSICTVFTVTGGSLAGGGEIGQPPGGGRAYMPAAAGRYNPSKVGNIHTSPQSFNSGTESTFKSWSVFYADGTFEWSDQEHGSYNSARPHQGIGQAIPEVSRALVSVQQAPPGDEGLGTKVISSPVLGGLHHDYRRAA